MAISINEIFQSAGLSPKGPVAWGEKFEAKYSGVYLVALTDDPTSKEPHSESFGLDSKTFKNWIQIAHKLEVNGKKATRPEQIKSELRQFWSQKENILYIGQSSSSTTNLYQRVKAYYSHKVGQQGAHTGGYWLKLLSCLNKTSIYYAKAVNPREAEFKMIMKYIEMTTGSSFYELNNLSKHLPFANLKVDILKPHLIKYATKPKEEDE